MNTCADWLWNQGSQRNGTVLPCLHTDECEWVWKRQERGFWDRGPWSALAFWRVTAPEIGGDVWVRLGVMESALFRAEEERC